MVPDDGDVTLQAPSPVHLTLVAHQSALACSSCRGFAAEGLPDQEWNNSFISFALVPVRRSQ